MPGEVKPQPGTVHCFLGVLEIPIPVAVGRLRSYSSVVGEGSWLLVRKISYLFPIAHPLIRGCNADAGQALAVKCRPIGLQREIQEEEKEAVIMGLESNPSLE